MPPISRRNGDRLIVQQARDVHGDAIGQRVQIACSTLNELDLCVDMRSFRNMMASPDPQAFVHKIGYRDDGSGVSKPFVVYLIRNDAIGESISLKFELSYGLLRIGHLRGALELHDLARIEGLIVELLDEFGLTRANIRF